MLALRLRHYNVANHHNEHIRSEVVKKSSCCFYRNGVEAEEEIYNVTYYGKGRMPVSFMLLFTSPAILLPQIYLVSDRVSYGSVQGFGENCTPRGQCTFGARLQEEEIKLLAKFVKLQADQGWPNIEESSED